MLNLHKSFVLAVVFKQDTRHLPNRVNEIHFDLQRDIADYVFA